MWLKLRNEVFKKDEIKDLPEGTENIGLPTTEELQEWLDETNTLVRKALKTLVNERIEREKEKMQESKNKSWDIAFHMMRERRALPPPAIRDPEGQLHFAPKKMHELVNDFWTKLVFRKFEKQDKINWEDVLERFPEAIGVQREQWQVPLIDGTSLRDRCAKVGGTHGLDGWRKKSSCNSPFNGGTQWHTSSTRLRRMGAGQRAWPRPQYPSYQKTEGIPRHSSKGRSRSYPSSIEPGRG